MAILRRITLGLPGLLFALPLGAACVWKVTGSNGETLYLGGSVHSLRSVDYPLPQPYNRAFDAADRLSFEIDPAVGSDFQKRFMGAGKYPAGDQLKNHVDPRTYEYLMRVLARSHLPESKIASYRPWFLSLMLESSGEDEFFHSLGVESFLEERAQANHKPMAGLESAREHADVFVGLSERESEAWLLLSFIKLDSDNAETVQILNAWRRGDADTLWRTTNDGFRDFPTMGQRLLANRNRRWIPKIEGYMRSHKTYFVVVGAAHMGGPDGLLALLKSRGYHIEQL